MDKVKRKIERRLPFFYISAISGMDTLGSGSLSEPENDENGEHIPDGQSSQRYNFSYRAKAVKIIF
jgi:hypothetical protein